MEQTLNESDISHIRKLSVTFSQKWTLEVLVKLWNGRSVMGFNELLRSIGEISPAVLSDRLKRLQEVGYVKREVERGPPTRTKYSLTEKGKDSMGYIVDFVINRKEKS